MLQCHFKPLYELTSSGKSAVVSCLSSGSVAGILLRYNSFLFGSVFGIYVNVHNRWCVALHNATLEGGKHQDKLEHSERKSLLNPKNSSLLRRDRWFSQHLKLCVRMFSAAPSRSVCCCASACEGSRCQHLILRLPKASRDGGRREEPRVRSTKSAECTFNKSFLFYWPGRPRPGSSFTVR